MPQSDGSAANPIETEDSARQFPLGGDKFIRRKTQICQVLFPLLVAGNPDDAAPIAGGSVAQWDYYSDHFFDNVIMSSICRKTYRGNRKMEQPDEIFFRNRL